ncbi:Hypothetical protein, putative [Bodo saltans]|uniref:Uncharacterized protein n=1 Tax=Bodo saltans TaxID=75058 RepID=A0A0S4IYN0_BODSA|nr:Hypothetical protein, putative [Bodo saltans]|eukprot:CUG53437.1 Hypothetical protein, putative [Bodo saltans]
MCSCAVHSSPFFGFEPKHTKTPKDWMFPQSPAPSRSSLFASSSSPSTLLAHTTTTQSRVVGLPSHLAAPPASSGYTAVPLVHQHQTHHSHNNNPNSPRDNDSQEGLFSSGSPAVIGAPSTSQPRSSSHQQQPSQQRSTIDADQQQRTL